VTVEEARKQVEARGGMPGKYVLIGASTTRSRRAVVCALARKATGVLLSGRGNDADFVVQARVKAVMACIVWAGPEIRLRSTAGSI
jgi:hypothetical protein